MELILTRCDKCKKAYRKEKNKVITISYSRFGYDHNTFDLCETCLNELTLSLTDQNDDFPPYVPGD